MPKHLDSTGVNCLTKVLNLSLTTLCIPHMGKSGRLVSLLKLAKLANLMEYYRLITLPFAVVKTFEVLLLPTFTHCLSLADNQHGFRIELHKHLRHRHLDKQEDYSSRVGLVKSF